MEKVSAVITTHNRCDLLKRAIESVLNQTYSSVECIVVDDGSTDKTSNICSQYPINYIFINPENSKGGNYARNLGIKAAKGKYIAFLDDDDYWLPTKIEKQMNLITSKMCEMVYCSRKVEIIDRGETIFKDHLVQNNYPIDLHKQILFGVCTVTSCILVKRDAIFSVGLFDEDLQFWQEYDLSIRISQRGPIYYLKEPLVVYRLDKGDKNRLTNKFYAWRNAVKYVHTKHRKLYDNLSKKEKIKAFLFYWRDAANRAKTNRLYYQYSKYRIISIFAKMYLTI